MCNRIIRITAILRMCCDTTKRDIIREKLPSIVAKRQITDCKYSYEIQDLVGLTTKIFSLTLFTCSRGEGIIEFSLDKRTKATVSVHLTPLF